MKTNFLGRIFSIILMVFSILLMIGSITFLLLSKGSGEQNDHSLFFLISTLLGVLLTAVSTISFFIQAALESRFQISETRAFPIYNTLNYDEEWKKIEKQIDKKETFLIEVNTSDYSNVAAEYLKQKIYESASALRCPKATVYTPSSFRLQSLNELLVLRKRKKRMVIIVDDETANIFELRNINSALSQNGEILNKKSKRAFDNVTIIFLEKLAMESNDDEDKKNNVADFITKYTAKSLPLPHAEYVVKFSNRITNFVRLFYIWKSDPKWKDFIAVNPSFVFPIYFLECGEYELALRVLVDVQEGRHEKNEDKTSDTKENKEKKEMCFLYLLADTCHLLCFYESSLEVLATLAAKRTSLLTSLQIRSIDLEAHVNKHLGNFFEAINEERKLTNCQCEESTSFVFWETNYRPLDSELVKYWRTKVLSRLSSMYYFLYLEKSLDNDFPFAEKYREKARLCIDRITEPNAQNQIYKAAYLITERPDESLRIINASIAVLSADGDRYLYNAYYVKGELLRSLGHLSEAYECYVKASGLLDNHGDFNLIDQCSFSIAYLQALGLNCGQILDTLAAFKARVVAEKSSYYETVKESCDCLKNSVALSENMNQMTFNKKLQNLVASNTLLEASFKKMMSKTVFVIL